MNIIFQFGEFFSDSDNTFLKDIIVTIIGSIFGTLGALWIWQIQVNREKSKNQFIKNQNDKEWIIYIRSLANSIKEDIEKEILFLEEFVINIRKNPYSVTLKKFKSASNLQRFNEKIDQRELFNILINCKVLNIKEFNTLYGCVDYFEAFLKQSYTNWGLFRDVQTDNQIGFSNARNKIISELYQVKFEYKNLGSESDTSINNSKIINDVINSINSTEVNKVDSNLEIHEKFENIGNDITQMYNNQINPLCKLIISPNFPEDPLNKRKNLIDSITEATNSYKKLQTQSSFQISGVENSISYIKTQLDLFKTIITKLNSY
jgi:hypothetical protein